MTDAVLMEERLSSLDGLTGAELVDCEIVGVAAERASLADIRFDECRFVDCQLRNAVVADARFTDTSFLRCSLVGVDWTRAAWSKFSIRPGLRFAECQLDYGLFTALGLQDVVMYGCSAVDADLGDCDLTDADLRFTDFTDARLDGATLIGADLRGATGWAFDLDDVRAKGLRVSWPEAAVLLQARGLVVAEAPLAEPAQAVLNRHR